MQYHITWPHVTQSVQKYYLKITIFFNQKPKNKKQNKNKTKKTKKNKNKTKQHQQKQKNEAPKLHTLSVTTLASLAMSSFLRPIRYHYSCAMKTVGINAVLQAKHARYTHQ